MCQSHAHPHTRTKRHHKQDARGSRGVPSCLTRWHAAPAAAQSCLDLCPSQTGCTSPCQTCPDHHACGLVNSSTLAVQCSARHAMFYPSRRRNMLENAMQCNTQWKSHKVGIVQGKHAGLGANTCWTMQCPLHLMRLVQTGAMPTEVCFTLNACRVTVASMRLCPDSRRLSCKRIYTQLGKGCVTGTIKACSRQVSGHTTSLWTGRLVADTTCS